MLERLRIQNFKGWKDTGSIRMAPITLFFGANSSGKSSIGHFLMMLKQTVESPDRKAVFYPGGRNTAVDLGSYRDMVFGRDPSRKISFEYGWSLRHALRFKDPDSDAWFGGDALAFEARVGLSGKDQAALAVEKFKYDLKTGRDLVLSIGMERESEAKRTYKIHVLKYPLKRNPGRAWPLGAPVRFYGFPDEVISYHQNAGFVQDLNLRHEYLFRSISYLGPLRTKPERLYSWAGIEPDSVGYAGENAVAAMLAARYREVSLGYRKRAKPFGEVIALKLQEMGLIEGFRVNPISEQRQEYEVKVRVRGSREWVDLPDVGFGVSQVLPVLVQAFYAAHGSIIVMEQPEIHLHPRAQSALADAMIDVVHSRENGEDRDIQLIIETHSEHFLRRLQRRIAENETLHDKIAAYFVNTTTYPARLEPLQIDRYGNIQNWPDRFFGDEMEDIVKQAKAALNKRSRLKGDKGAGISE